MPEPTSCCRAAGGYCDRCDLLVGLDGLHVLAVERDPGDRLTVTVESAPEPMGRPVRIVWRKRRWVCPEPDRPVGSFVEQDERIAAPRATLRGGRAAG